MVIDGKKKVFLKGDVVFSPYTDPKSGKVDKTKVLMRMVGVGVVILKDGTAIYGQISRKEGSVIVTPLSGEEKKYEVTEIKDFKSLTPGMIYNTLRKINNPKHKSADIVGWCANQGDKATVDDWLSPSKWIRERTK